MSKPVFVSPPKLIPHRSTVGVISPSRSLSIIDQSIQKISRETLASCGFNVIVDPLNYEVYEFDSPSISSKLTLIHRLTKDPSINVLLTSIGGFNSNSIIEHLDYDLIKANPKIWCGFSDITAILNAITVRTRLITYYGPHFSTFGMVKNNDYTIDSFLKITTTDKPQAIKPSKLWSDDEWYLDQDRRVLKKNSGHVILQPGQAKGLLFGGHLSTYGLLRGTKWYPQEKNTILFVETDQDSPEYTPNEFDRELEAILQTQKHKLSGLIIGRFIEKSTVTLQVLRRIIESKDELRNIPIIANIDFGHTSPITTLPIGGTMVIDTQKNPSMKILCH